MKRALFVCLTLTSATGSAGEKVFEGTEQTGLLQKVNRDQITSNKIKQVAATLTQLFQSASQLLRSGATPKVVTFSKETLQQIKDAVLPALVDETKQDKKSLDDILAKFPPLVATYTSHIAELDNFRKAEKTLSDEHKVCRVKQQKVCDDCTECMDEEKELWEEKITAEKICNNSKKELCDEVSFVPYNCAEVNGLTSCTWNRRTKAETYIEKCEEYFNKTQGHKEWKEKCHKICDQVDKKLPVRTPALLEVVPTIKQECNELKSQLEAGSCKSSVRYTSALEALNAAWSILERLYDGQTKAVLAKVKDRKVECGTITSVECLLENINDKPCGDPEVDERIGKCRKEPNCTWLDIEIPMPPVKPGPPPPAPHPCTPDFVAQEYGNLTSECFDLPPCVGCGPEPPTPGPIKELPTPAPFVVTQPGSTTTTTTWFCVAYGEQTHAGSNPSASNKVIGVYSSLADAKKVLNKRESKFGHRQMICEMTTGGAKGDPHSVGGENQGGGPAAGFNKWWADGGDIKKMTKLCNDDASCRKQPNSTGAPKVVTPPFQRIKESGWCGKNIDVSATSTDILSKTLAGENAVRAKRCAALAVGAGKQSFLIGNFFRRGWCIGGTMEVSVDQYKEWMSPEGKANPACPVDGGWVSGITFDFYAMEPAR